MKIIRPLLISGLLFTVFSAIGTGAGLYWFPRQEFARVTTGNIENADGTWKLLHKREPVDADFTDIVKPSVDFLYSSAVLDSASGAWVLSIPPIDRYFVFQFIEDDTDAFAYVGSRTHGRNKPIEVLIKPAGYSGDAQGLETITLKSDMVWMLARFQLLGDADAPNVHAIQNAVRLEPVEAWTARQSVP